MKSLCLFTNIFGVKQKIQKHRDESTKLKRRAMKLSNSLWTKTTKQKGHSKIYDQIKRNMYAWITRNPRVFQLPIYNDCLKVMFNDQTEPQLVPNILPQVFVRELHNSLVSDPNDGGIKDARAEDDYIIISDSTFFSQFPQQLKLMSAQ